MNSRGIRVPVLVAVLVVAAGVGGIAQSVDVTSRLGYADMVLYNGKIVTMDDPSFEPKVGTIVQAMAIRDGKIFETGTDRAIRPLAGPRTTMVDLKGRTILPSFIISHEHPTDWAFQEPRALTHVFPTDDNDVVIHRWMPNLPPAEQVARFEPVFKDALAKAKPGQWVWLSFNYGPNYEHATEMALLFGKTITKEYLDRLAPNNPVKVRNGFITSVVNRKGIDALVSADPNQQEDTQFVKTGFGFSRPVEPDAMFTRRIPQLAQVLKAELEWWASNGATLFVSSPYAFNNLAALRWLDQRGEIPTRFAWGYSGPAWDPGTLRYMASVVNTGTDHLWMVGAFAGSGGNCMSVPVRSEWKQNRVAVPGRRADDQCSFDPGTPGRRRIEDAVRAGMRIATIHTGGDKDIDNLLDAIEKGSREAGFTLEEMRARRHAFDHSAGAPRPQQIPRLKQLGMMASLNNNLLWEPMGVVPNMMGVSMISKVFGVEYANWVTPRKSMTEGGVMTSFEIDRPLANKILFFITKGMNRYHDHDGRVYGERERTDRIIQLKAITRWGAYYVLRENLLGTLERGKFADFIVLDKDFLTVPEDQIPSIRVLMTVVGGKTVHLVTSLANEIGVQPVGYTTWKEKIPEGW